MNDKQRAAADLRKLQQMLRGIIELGPDLERLGSLEQAEQEARARVDELAAIETRTKQVIAAAKVAAETTLKEAAASAEAIRKQAKEDAERLIADAQSRATVIDESTKEATEKLTALRLELAQTQRRFDEINAQLEALKARF